MDAEIYMSALAAKHEQHVDRCRTLRDKGNYPQAKIEQEQARAISTLLTDMQVHDYTEEFPGEAEPEPDDSRPDRKTRGPGKKNKAEEAPE